MVHLEKKQLILPGLALFIIMLAACSNLFIFVSPSVALSDHLAALQYPSFTQGQFANRWYYSDKALVDYPQQANRSWTWGPTAYSLPGGVTTEPYEDAPGGKRAVQYFDKARMELNSQAPLGSLYDVTTGLLVKELVTGFRQDGDNAFTRFNPSTLQVAGDANLNGNNQVAPVYASFGKVISRGGSSERTGQTIDQAIDRAGQESKISPPFKVTYTSYNSVTGHNIAGVFEEYFNQSGLIWNGSGYETGSPFFNNPTYIFGLPLTEPYWIKAEVKGQESDVLVQLFERRTLTYTPANSDPYKVEMGNVGQHYYQWRYGDLLVQTVDPTITLDNSGQTLSLKVEERFVLSLGEGYDWTITLSNEGVIQRIVNITPLRGSQGVYQALKAGQVTLAADGEPGCRKVKPACGLPSRLFTLTVIVQ